MVTVASKACSSFASNGPPTVGIHKVFPACPIRVLEPEAFERNPSPADCVHQRALWKLNWFLRDFGYDIELLTQDQMDEKALINLRGVVRTSHVTLNGHTFQNLEAFAPAAEWKELSHSEVNETHAQERR